MIPTYSTVEDIWQVKPRECKKLLKNLNLKQPGLEKVESAYLQKRIPEALHELLHYYNTTYDDMWVSFEPFFDRPEFMEELADISKDIFTFQTVRAKIPRLENGHLDWGNRGPHNDREFGFFLNRQHYFKVLYNAYKETKDEKYIQQFNNLMLDWIIANPCPKRKNNSVQWRALEAALRIFGAWVNCFFGFLHSNAFSPAVRLLMLIELPKHAEYLKKYVVRAGNIRVMEYTTMALIGAHWPEFKRSDMWVSLAIRKLIPEILNIQVYPDGPQKELTQHYHSVSMNFFELCSEFAHKRNLPIPKEYDEKIETMWNYYVYPSRPDGSGLLNNDGDRDDHIGPVKKAANRFHREDWLYIVTNGEEGKQPTSLTYISPWAGHLISRNGWHKNAHWAFFDFGPLGTGHVHRDKLHLSISAYGRDFLVDGGRFRYIRDKWRSEYFLESVSHNTILIDGNSQKNFQRESKVPIGEKYYRSTPLYDFAIGTFDSGYKSVHDSVKHTRAYIYLRDRCWVVIDHISLSKAHEIQPLWHFHPDCDVHFAEQDPNNQAITTTDKDQGNLLIVPFGDINWDLSFIRGQEFPYIQGWWSRRYNHKEPSTCVEYKSKITHSKVFGWIMGPFLNQTPEISVKIHKIDHSKGDISLKVLFNSDIFEIEIENRNVKILK